VHALLREASGCELLGTGFHSAEGPIWVAEGEYLLFSDIAGDNRRRWDERDGLRVVAQPTAKANGMTLDATGRLIVCEHVTSALVAMDADGSGTGRVVLASHFGGHELNSPNDVVVAADGSIYFTDPPGGRMEPWGLARDRELGFMGVFRLPPTGELELVGEFDFPNGLCLSPDESLLYVNETTRERVLVHDLAADGTASNRRVFAEGIGPREQGTVDGMKCDEDGNVWVTGPGCIQIFDPAGRGAGRLPVPGRPLNLHWGGPDWSWLFVTTTTSLYRFRTRTRGRREPFMH
jgi:gluconolactonase